MKAGDLKSEEIFEIFRVSSIRLMDNQIEKWDKKIGNLNNHLGKFKEKLKNGLSEDNFKYEIEKNYNPWYQCDECNAREKTR